MELVMEDFLLINGICTKLELGDLIAVRNRGWLGRLRNLLTSKHYRHMAVYVGHGRVIEAQRFRKVGYQSLAKYQGCYDVFRYNDPLTEFQKMRILYSLRSKIGLPHDRMEIAIRWMKALLRGTVSREDQSTAIAARLIRDAYSFAGLPMPQGVVTILDLTKWHGFHML